MPGVPNTDHESCAAISLSSALRETLPGQTTETAAEFVANARAAFPEVKNPFLLLEALAPPELTIHARRVSGCGCPSSVAEAPQTGVTYYRPSTTETQRPVHIQAICSSLSYPHPYRCDACHALTTTSQCFDGTPEYVVIDTPRQRYVPEGDLAVDDAFPGVFHETRRPVYFNGAPYRTMAVICQVPGHFVTVIPRGHTFLCVDDGHPVRPLSRSDVTTLFKGTLLTFLARLHSKPAQQVRFQPTSSASTETAQPVNPTSIGSVAVATSISPCCSNNCISNDISRSHDLLGRGRRAIDNHSHPALHCFVRRKRGRGDGCTRRRSIRSNGYSDSHCYKWRHPGGGPSARRQPYNDCYSYFHCYSFSSFYNRRSGHCDAGGTVLPIQAKAGRLHLRYRHRLTTSAPH